MKVTFLLMQDEGVGEYPGQFLKLKEIFNSPSEGPFLTFIMPVYLFLIFS